MKPYKVIGIYYPPFLKCWKIGFDLTKLTKALGYTPLNDPKHPAQDWAPWSDLPLHAEVKNFTPYAPDGKVWHQDGDTTPGSRMDCSIILWCNDTPTEFKGTSILAQTLAGVIYQPKPFEVVIFNNLDCYHRQPPTAPDRRYIFRQRVEKLQAL